jgi:hypothetical protein
MYFGGTMSSSQTGAGEWSKFSVSTSPTTTLWQMLNNDAQHYPSIMFIDMLMEYDGSSNNNPWIPGQETNIPYAILGDNTLFAADIRLTRDTINKYDGTGSIKASCPGSGGNEGVAFVGENLTPSTSYTMGCRVKAVNGITYYLTVTDGLSYYYTSSAMTGNGSFQSVTHTDTAPATGTLYYLVYYSNNTVARDINVDQCMLSEGVVALTWTPGQSTLVFRPVKDQVFYNKKTENDIVINNKLFYFQFHKGDATKICSIYDFTGRKVLVLSDETNSAVSDDFNMELDPFETEVEMGNSKFIIKLGMEFFEIQSIGTPVRYPQKRFVVATSPSTTYGYQEAIQIQAASMLIDRTVAISAPQLNYTITPSFMHWNPGENLSFETITNVKNVHPSDGFNDETYKNFIGISGFTPKVFNANTATVLNMSRMTNGTDYGGVPNYNKGKYGSNTSWYLKLQYGLKYTAYAMINNSSNSLGSSFDFWVDSSNKGRVTVGSGTYSRFVHLGDFTATGATQRFVFVPKDKTTYTGFHYILLVPKSGGFSQDVIDSTSPYRLRELALSDLKMAFEVGD